MKKKTSLSVEIIFLCIHICVFVTEKKKMIFFLKMNYNVVPRHTQPIFGDGYDN